MMYLVVTSTITQPASQSVKRSHKQACQGVHRLVLDRDLKPSALNQHTTEAEHNINFEGTKYVATTDLLQKRIIREALGVNEYLRDHYGLRLHPPGSLPTSRNFTKEKKTKQKISRLTRILVFFRLLKNCLVLKFI